ncbi:MAG: cyclic nucleotide-binding domain-containing protein [Lachnospiraceae bacterium]|nr:cyclic nucleotide-binding domain-containing protein [Lachnospiraceae bacterium]
MSERINEKYLADFFGIDINSEGNEELAGIKAGLKKLSYKNNDDICKIGTPADGMYFIEHGAAVVLDSDEKQLNILHKGQYFGEYAVLSGENRLSTVRALGRCVVFKMESKDLLAFLSRHPGVYGQFIKRVYAQLSNKHSQVIALTGMRRGVLSSPSNTRPMSKKQMVLQYGILFLIYLAAMFLIPADPDAPLFLIPLIFMLVYVLITKRTRESLITSGILAGALVYRAGLFAGYADSLMDTMGQRDNVFTVLVMALMGAMVNLIVQSGGVTAFEKTAIKHCKTPRGVFLSALGIMAVTSIDDGLNMLTSSYAVYTPAREKGVIREKLALIFSMLPTVLCSFFPLSLWGIFVMGTISAATKENAAVLFTRSIPYNFFSIITLIAMVLFGLGCLPGSRQLKEADKRYRETGALWPKGSEKYLSVHDTEVWGKISNVILPIIVLAISSFAIRSLFENSLVADSCVGLIATLVFMFLLYCFRDIMTPEQFMEHLFEGISQSTLPIVLYILTINFSSLLDSLGLQAYLADMIDIFEGKVFLIPAVTFVLSMMFTVALGSSWSMYAITFPIVLSLAGHLGISSALMAGAIAAGGIAGEKNCAFTADALNVGLAVGIDPAAVRSLRVTYSAVFTVIAAVAYLIAGLIST